MAELQAGGSNDNMELDQATVPDEDVDSHIIIESTTNSALHSFGPENIQSTDTGDKVDDSAGFNPNVSDDELRSSFIQSSGPENIQPRDSGEDVIYSRVDDLEISDDVRNDIRDSMSASGNDICDSTSASGYREADEAYNRFFEEYFPNYREGVHKVPRVFFGNHPYIVNAETSRDLQSSLKETVPVYLYGRAESDIAGDRAEKIVADSIEKLLMEENHPAFIITSFKFMNFCNKDESPQHDQNKYVKKQDGKAEERKQGEHDLLIVHLKYGVIFIQVKSTQENTDPTNTTKKAISQTEKDEEFFKANFDDIILNNSDMISSTIALPDIEREKLDSRCKTKIEKKYEKNGKLDHCLFKDEVTNMAQLRKWWSDFTTKSVGFKTIDDYKRVVARYIGKKSTVKVPGIHHRESPNESFPDGRIYSDCVSEMGNRYMNIVLTPEQVYILNYHLPRLVIHGQFGTGKTVLLILKVRRLLRENKKVCVITLCVSPLEHVLKTSITHKMNEVEIAGLEFKQARDQEELSKILKDCAKLDRHVFIDEFPSFTIKNDNLHATVKRYPKDLIFWCIMSRERSENLSSPIDDLFYLKQHCGLAQKTCSTLNSSPESATVGNPGPPNIQRIYSRQAGSAQDETNHQQSESRYEAEGTFIRLRMSKMLRCPPTVHTLLPSTSKLEKEIVRYNFGNLKVLRKELSRYFHSLGLSTPKTINVLEGKKPTGCNVNKWKDIVVVSAESLRPFYSTLMRLKIPLAQQVYTFDEKDKTNNAQYVFEVPGTAAFKRVAIVTSNLHCSVYVKGQGDSKIIDMKDESIAQLLTEYGFIPDEHFAGILKRRGLNESEIKKRLDEVGIRRYTNNSPRDWSEVIFVEETMSYAVLRDLGIPFVTPAEDTVVNKVLFTTNEDFKGFSRKEVIVFKDGKAIANPCEDICFEGPTILRIDHTEHAQAIHVCCPCTQILQKIIQDLGLIDNSETRANTVPGGKHLHPSAPNEPRTSSQPTSVTENILAPRHNLTLADLLIVDVRQNPESIARLFQECRLPVVDKLNAEFVDVDDMFSSSSVMYVKPRMATGLEKKVVFVVRKRSEKLVSHSRCKIIEDPLMLACTRYTSQLVIITTN